MDKAKIIKAIIDDAMAALRYDDANPDVGWGLFTTTAVDDAVKKQKQIARSYGVELVITEAERDAMVARIDRMRSR